MDVYFDIENISKIIEQVNVYSRDESLIVSEFKNIFEDFGDSYLTENSDSFYEIGKDISVNLEKVVSNTNNDLTYLNSYLEKDKELEHSIVEGYENLTTQIKSNYIDE